MAINEGLELIISADVQSALKGLADLKEELKRLANTGQGSLGEMEQALKALEKQIKLSTDPAGLLKLNKAAADLKGRINELKSAGTVAAPALKKLGDSSNAANQSLINLGRVVQDAPFGFLGIANNLNPLLESFQRLKAETGSSSAAFKSLRASLTGAAGIGIGLSIVSTLLISFGDDLLRALSPSQKFSDAIKKAAESIDEKAASVIGLVAALKSDTLTTEQATKAKKELIKIAPEFQSSFDGNSIKVGEADIALTKYIKQLVTTTRVTAALGIVNESLAKSIKTIAEGGTLTFGQQLKTAFKGIFDQTGALADAGKEGIESINKATDALKPENVASLIEETFKKLGITFGDFVDTIDETKDKAKKSLDSLRNDIISKAKQFVKEFGESFVVPNLEESFFKTKEDIFRLSKKLLDDVAKRKLKIKIPAQVEFELLPETTTGVTDDTIKAFNDDLKSRQETFSLDFSLSKESVSGIDKMIERFSQFGDKGIKAYAAAASGARNFSEVLKGLEQNEKTQLVLANAIGDSFSAVFDSVIAGTDALDGFFKGLGRALENLIRKLIATAAAAGILTLLSGGTFAGAKGFSAIFAKISGFAEGGIVSAPTLGLIGEGAGTRNSNPEIVAPLNKLKDILGDSGGSQRVSGTLKASGSELIAVIESTERRQGRSF